jgi:peptidyl-prolyl cis-trans isomerase C
VTLTAEELQSAVEADGTWDAVRRIEAVIVSTDELDQGFPATEESLADARERAAAAADDLAAGVDPAEVAETHGPAQHQSAWISYEDLANTEWADLVFAAEVDTVTPPVEDEVGYQLISLVTGSLDEQPDPGFVEAVNDQVGEGIHRRNVELEALADKLEQHVTDQAVATEYEHVRLAEILIERSSAGSDDSAGEARASHILYQPETPLDEAGEPTDLADLPADDPAWAAAEAEARAAADELAAIEDVDERKAAFAERAIAESDGPSGPDGGDLGWFAREMMVQPFSDAIWENLDPASGDILGPVRTEFGWHVILFDGFRSSLDVRVSDVQAALAAEGADFAAVAREYSDGPEAADGGETGWHVLDFLDDDVVIALSAVEMGEPTEPVDGGDGYRIYQKLEQASRPLDEADAAEVRASAFGEWYDERYFDALDDGTVSIDESIYE